MSAAETIYSQINTLRQDAYDRDAAADAAMQAGHTLDALTADDWNEDATYGRTLGAPEEDYCVSIDGDRVRVFAAGDLAAEAVIAGAGTL